MSDAESSNGRQQNESSNIDPLQLPSPPPGKRRGAAGDDPSENHQNAQPQQNPSNRIRFWGFFSKHEWVMVFLTAVIAATGVVGVYLVVKGKSDTQKMITAAQRQACAAHQFADSAKLINGNITAAVEKLALQARDSEAFFRTDERAWIEIGKIETAIYPPDPPFGIIFKYRIFLRNYGKTVATDVRVHVDNIEADSSFGDNQKAIRMSQNQLFKISGTNKRSTEPNKPGPQTIAPQELTTIPIFSGGQEPRKWGNGFRYTFVLGRIDYNDAFGKSHWMRFCYIAVDSRGELGHCTYGNEEDSNPEIPN